MTVYLIPIQAFCPLIATLTPLGDRICFLSLHTECQPFISYNQIRFYQTRILTLLQHSIIPPAEADLHLTKINTVMIRFTQKFILGLAIATTVFSCSTLPEDPRTWEGLYPQKSLKGNHTKIINNSSVNLPNQNTEPGIIHNLEAVDAVRKLPVSAK